MITLRLRSGRPTLRLAAAIVFAIGLAAVAVAQDQRMPTIDHVSPARDSVGSAPQRFEWTAVKGADSYSIGVWSEVDVLWWRQDNIPTNSVVWGGDRPLEPGTYFWSVTAVPVPPCMVVVFELPANVGIGSMTMWPHRLAMLSGKRVMYHSGIQTEAILPARTAGPLSPPRKTFAPWSSRKPFSCFFGPWHATQWAVRIG